MNRRPLLYPHVETERICSLIPDYVGFIKKIMKLMQQDYPMIAKIEVELTQEKEMDHLPNRPSKF